MLSNPQRFQRGWHIRHNVFCTVAHSDAEKMSAKWGKHNYQPIDEGSYGVQHPRSVSDTQCVLYPIDEWEI